MKKKLLKLQKHNKEITGSISLPASKSISNRVLIINALSYNPLPINNIAECEDTLLLQRALTSNSREFNTGDGGTTIRFLTAFLSKIVGEWTVICSQRMKDRPIQILVDALNYIGAKISYLEKEGYPPLKIEGSYLNGGKLTLSGNTSSQYISALLLIAPTLPDGLSITIIDEIVSSPYIQMTIHLMHEFGVECKWTNNTIIVEPQDYIIRNYTVEADWTAASYWYSLLAISQKSGSLHLKGLFQNSCQGDCRQTKIWELFGISTKFSAEGITIEKTETPLNLSYFTYDFRETPDLAQTFAVVCSMLDIPFHFKGLETLRIKETNRIDALIIELGKLGFILNTSKKGDLHWNGEKKNRDNSLVVETYNDHRMAMSFAPIATRFPISINNAEEVVKKSYPRFWEDLRELGLFIE